MPESKAEKAEKELRQNGWLGKIKVYLKSLGPGLITGASDDDPSGIGTYSQTGAQFGYTGGLRTEEPFLGTTSERILRSALVPVMVAKKPLSTEAKTFFVPTDFSSYARKAAEEALMLARKFSARVIFFHVLDMYSSFTIAYAHELGVSVATQPPSPEELEPEWKAFLSGLPLDKVDWEKCTEEGQAATSIVHQAKRMQADMIVIGTHGRSGSPHLLLGSVAESVVRTASCPVLTIRPESCEFEMP